ncbi:trypsin-like peptidase domain-containing protein [Kribbella turkmenica]|uniref:trypsin-like peptidase domain-containing protein n=1 Tax=Kribbella turkmenica TaxID=2530375 RepID=UPI001F1F8E65|nr:trypsin-like peptidase domain-containing protein [Kribbella turkmenica]
MQDGRPLPRPPRRVPAAAATLTQLQTSTPPRSPQPPARRPWTFGRFLAGFVAVLLILAAGASAGWYVRAQSLRIDTEKVLDSVRGGVVHVLATTCEGTGQATGVLIGDGLVLTAASALEQPLSIVIATDDGRVRRVNQLGRSADGVAVLRMIGRLDRQTVPLASRTPDPMAERALIGYTSAGVLTSRPIGTTEQPLALSTVMSQSKLGGPVVDKSGHVVGLVAGDTAPTSAIVSLDRLRGYVAPEPTGMTAEPGGSCERSRGPQTAVLPELLVASTPLALEAQKLLGTYLTLENRHDFEALRPVYSKSFGKRLTLERDRNNHQTSYFFNARITEVTRAGEDGVNVRMTYAVLFSPNASGADGQACNRRDLRYLLVREGGQLRMHGSKEMQPVQSCDAD